MGGEASVTALETSRAVLYSAGILIIPRSRYFSLPCINQRLELTDDGFSAMAESQFLPFFIRRPPKSIFSQFLHFVGRRQTVFIVFHVSAAADGLFSLFFAFRRSTMSVFSQFLHFAYERRMIFSVFHSSEGWEMQPAAFFGFPKRRKADFRCFSCFPMLGWPFSFGFHASQVWESRFSPFSFFPKFGNAFFCERLLFLQSLSWTFLFGVRQKLCIFAPRLIDGIS